MRKRLNLKLVGLLLGGVIALSLGTFLLHGYQVRRNSAALRYLAEEAESDSELDRSAKYYRLYLLQNPNDTGILARYGKVQIKLAKTRKERFAAMLILDQVVRRQPDNYEVRREVVEQAMHPDLQQFTEAKEHLVALCRVFPNEGELQFKLGRCEEAFDNPAAAETAYATAIKLTPTLAEAYRDLAELQNGKLKRPADAVKTLDLLVTSNPQQARAWLYRARHLRLQAIVEPRDEKRQSLFGKAAADLAQAALVVSQDESGAEVLLETIELALTRAQIGQARSFVQRGLEKYGKDVRFHLAGARVETMVQRRQEAIAHLRRGLEQGPDNLDVLWSLALLVIEGGDWSEADLIQEKLRQGRAAPPLLDYLQARVLARKSEWLEASRLLQKVRPQLASWPDKAVQADLLQSRCHANLGDSDQQELDLRRALVVDPHSEAACLSLGNVLLAQGKHAKAFETFRAASSSSQARLFAAHALILHNLSLPPAQRRWDEVESFVESVAKASDTAEAALLRTDILVGKNQLARATEELATVLAKSPEKPVLWGAQAALLQRQGKWQDALALLDEAEKKLGQRVEFHLARARFWAERGGSEASVALHALEKHLVKYQDTDWQRLAIGLAEAWRQLGQTKETASLYALLAEKDRHDLGVRLMLFDLALPANQDDQVQHMLADMRRIEGVDGTYWRLGEVGRLLHQARQGQQKPADEVPQLLKAIAERRPHWSRLFLAEAEWEELSGRPENAIGKFQQAIDAGEGDPAVLRRAVVLLYERRRYVEAEELLQKLHQSASPLLSGLERMSAELALFQNDGGRALKIARKAVSADSKDYRELLWLGNILSAADQWKDAEAVLRRAVALNDKVPETWLALVRCLAHMDRKPEAEALLQSARVKLPADQSLLTLAQGHEILGQLAKAGELYESARAARPKDATVLRNLARFLFRSGRLAKAAPHFRTILELPTRNPEDDAWARRHLAFILVADGDYRKRHEALAVLGIGDVDQLRDLTANWTSEDQRVLAVVLSAQQNRPQLRMAISILESLVRKESRAADRFLLAQLYRNVGDTRSADEQILSLLAEQPDEPAFLSFYLQRLLASKRLDEVEPLLGRYEKVQPGALDPLRLRTYLLHARGKDEQAVELLSAFTAVKPGELRAVAQLLDELGQPVAAEETYRQLIGRKERPEDVLLLATFLGKQKRVAEGLELCTAAWKTCPPNAVANASLTVLTAGKAAADSCRQVAAKLEEVRRTTPSNAEILRVLAMVRSLEGRNPEAIGVYQELIRRDPKDAQALNNLAWLMTISDGKGEKGLALIQKAIEIAGPRPAFLDTRAMIHLALGQTTPAIRDLEEVVAEQPSAHRHFHLAQAYYKAGRRDVAEASWRRAVAAGLQQALVDPGELAVYQKLAHDLAHSN